MFSDVGGAGPDAVVKGEATDVDLLELLNERHKLFVLAHAVPHRLVCAFFKDSLNRLQVLVELPPVRVFHAVIRPPDFSLDNCKGLNIPHASE